MYASTLSHSRSAQALLSLDDVRRVAPSAFATEKHGSRSEAYTYIPTSQVIEGMITQGFHPFAASQSRARDAQRREFTKHMIRFRHGAALEKAGYSQPEVVVVNSHDGTSAYKLFAGIFRSACLNGLIVADSMVGSLSVPHKGNIVDKVIEGSFEVLRGSDAALAKSREWSGLMLTSGEQAAFAEAAHTLRFAGPEGHVETPIRPDQLLSARRYGDDGPDLWRTFNRVQENVIRGGLHGVQRGPSGRRRNVTTREIKGIDQDVRLNRALWTLAERMAELKTGAAA